ncbi:MAG: MOSC domain-containing protein [Desulfomonile tiedjei]|uniref:MOSC domain-containing protein n=1 Tax=Desulfomonile tiedjei TaxID=2358 RepID=A0A9D6V692_9BACT|nr:MOSC domain-containing protein [Desulfomonile tiedjei]
MSSGRIIAVCTSVKKGTTKADVGSAIVEAGFGIKGDAHGGDWHRQISLLSMEQIGKMKEKGLDVKPGSFAENLTTQDFDLGAVKIGDRLRIGGTILLEVTQIGKECHTRCAIFNKVGECIMPEQGVFTRVIEGGEVSVGDAIELA